MTSPPIPFPSTFAPPQTWDDGMHPVVRLAIHDASRIEWTVWLPLPEERDHLYSIDATIEVPARVFVDHRPWDHLQSVTRLDAPGEESSSEDATVDALRRKAVATALRLARVGEGFAHQARCAPERDGGARPAFLEGTLGMWLDTGTSITHQVRRELREPTPSPGGPLAHERQLVDEYISTRYIEMLGGAKRGLTTLASLQRGAPTDFHDMLGRLEDQVARALEAELHHRHAQGYVCAFADNPRSMEEYVKRASLLKKHFQEILFLDSETVEVAQKLHHWVAGFAALVASTWAFVWQLTLSKQLVDSPRVGPQLLALAGVAGMVYATKDRIKEMGRTWLSGHVHRLFAQRVVRLRMPSRRLATRDVVATARETIHQEVREAPDPLHPESGAVNRLVELRFCHKGALQPCPSLTSRRIRGVKYIFRYDLSPLFNRLGDAVRKVAVLDPTTRRLVFGEAPRCYQVPVHLRVRAGSHVREEAAILVLSKRGLEHLRGAATPVPGRPVAPNPGRDLETSPLNLSPLASPSTPSPTVGSG